MNLRLNVRLPVMQLRRFALLAMLPLLICACKTLQPTDMVPRPAVQSAATSGMSVRVTDVTGGKETSFGGPEMVNNEKFKKALILALQQSRIFSDVGSKPADLDLSAIINLESQRLGRGIEFTATLTVTYRLLDRNGNLVWSSSYDSEASSVAFGGEIRTANAREGSVRGNLESLLLGLREDWLKKHGTS